MPGRGWGIDAHVALAGEHCHLIWPAQEQGEGLREDHPTYALLQAGLKATITWRGGCMRRWAASCCHGHSAQSEWPGCGCSNQGSLWLLINAVSVQGLLLSLSLPPVCSWSIRALWWLETPSLVLWCWSPRPSSGATYYNPIAPVTGSLWSDNDIDANPDHVAFPGI